MTRGNVVAISIIKKKDSNKIVSSSAKRGATANRNADTGRKNEGDGPMGGGGMFITSE